MLKIFLMTRNDVESIEDWIIYHGYLFGLENLYLVDGSDDEEVLAIYDFYEKYGINVLRTDVGLNGLADEITSLMHKYKGEDNFLIKLDSDEFLTCVKPSLLRRRNSPRGILRMLKEKMRFAKGKPARHEIKYYDFLVPDYKELRVDFFTEFFQGLPKSQYIYKAGLTTGSNPSQDCLGSPSEEIVEFTALESTDFKSFFHSDGFVTVDLGSHRGESVKADKVIYTGLCVVHYHFTGISDFVSRAKKVLLSHGFINEDDALEIQELKLEKLISNGETLSLHKIDFYLSYLKCRNDSDALEELVSGYRHPMTEPSDGKLIITIVRDTLGMIKGRGKFPVRKNI
jgi:hypothetical protein